MSKRKKKQEKKEMGDITNVIIGMFNIILGMFNAVSTLKLYLLRHKETMNVH